MDSSCTVRHDWRYDGRANADSLQTDAMMMMTRAVTRDDTRPDVGRAEVIKSCVERARGSATHDA